MPFIQVTQITNGRPLWINVDHLVAIRVEKDNVRTGATWTLVRIADEPSWIEVDETPNQIVSMCEAASR